ncbi:MAG: hypothetical protein WAZ48_16085 [Lysobacteraceae bacterium]
MLLCATASLSMLLGGCGAEMSIDMGTDTTSGTGKVAGATTSRLPAKRPVSRAAAAAIQNPILFVTQVPTPGDVFASRGSTFANHLGTIVSAPRGGDLMLRYPDGTLRNLTREAGYGMEGQQGANAIAVREPTVHWSGTKAIFSMVIGAPPSQYTQIDKQWQMYEVTGLGKGQPVVITKVPGQPASYNNVSPFYASDDRILFTSDRPRGGEAHLYPQLDEYESTATITGIHSLNPETGQVSILNHTPSGAFSPFIDSYGRILFTRWDHLQRDQQADAGTYGAFNSASEAANAAKLAQTEVFPESRLGMGSPYGNVRGFTYNLFTPWEMHQDGSGELSLNHIGRHEMSFGYLSKSFDTDPALQEFTNEAIIANRKHIGDDAGIFHIHESPQAPGIYYGIYTREFGTLTSNQIVRFTGAPGVNPEQMTIVDASAPETNGSLVGGRFRNPLPLTSGQMVASYTASATVQEGVQFRLHQLATDGNGMFTAGTPLTTGINKTVSWWSPDVKLTYSGPLWEFEAVEVVARARPAAGVSPIEAIEKAVLNEEQVDERMLRDWMKANQLALIVTRNQTSRDRADRQQPFNLRLPSGLKTTGDGGRVYDIAHYQIFEAAQIRGYNNFRSGKRPLAQPMAVSKNPANPSGPPSSVKIAADGSTAAFVPANRALTWQTTDASGAAIVRERIWVTMQPGEIRTCAGCHGENTKNQAGQPAPANKPEALRELLRYWKQNLAPTERNGSRARVRPRTTQASTNVPPTASNTAAVSTRFRDGTYRDGTRR